MLQLLMWIPFIFTLSVLTYVAILDIKKREVSNLVWLFCYPISCVMTFLSVATGLFESETVLVSVGISVGLGLCLFFVGFYGGADCKALVFVGLTLPISPHTAAAPAMPLVLTVFCNAAVLSLVWPLSIFILNLKDTLNGKNMFEGIKVSLKKKVWMLFTLRKVSLEQLSLKYLPAETIEVWDGKPVRRLLHFVRAETDLTKHLKILEENKELCKKGVLASPTIPSICFFTPALVISVFGNLLFLAAVLFFGV